MAAVLPVRELSRPHMPPSRDLFESYSNLLWRSTRWVFFRPLLTIIEPACLRDALQVHTYILESCKRKTLAVFIGTL
jgi:hypothetical protein